MKKCSRFAAILLGAASIAYADSQVFRFGGSNSQADIKEIANAIRTVAEIPDVKVDSSAGTLSVGGTAEQVALASWIFSELNGPPSQGQAGAISQYGGAGDPVWLYHLANTGSREALLEMLNTLRNIGSITKVFPKFSGNELVVRASPGQQALAAWLVRQLDRPVGQAASGGNRPQFRTDDFGIQRLVQVFYLAHANSPAAMQNIANLLRKQAQLTMVYPNNAEKAIVARGTDSEIARAAQLVAENDVAH